MVDKIGGGRNLKVILCILGILIVAELTEWLPTTNKPLPYKKNPKINRKSNYNFLFKTSILKYVIEWMPST